MTPAEFIMIFYLFVMATVLANLEIQIEGKNGWAENLPAWRSGEKNLFAGFYARIMNGKPLTGYHIAIFSFVILVFHFPFVSGAPLTIENWLKTVSRFFIYLAVWDFLWFVFNPYFTLKRFRPQNIPWHRSWIGAVPRDYVNALVASFIAIIPLFFFSADRLVLRWWLTTVSVFLILTAAAILLAGLIVKKRV